MDDKQGEKTPRSVIGEKMRKLLMIAYNFPPLTTSGMYRSLQFARFLPQFGWEPTVLTIRTDTVRSPGPLDDSPLRELPADFRVERTTVFEPLHMAVGLRNRIVGDPNRGCGEDGPRPNGNGVQPVNWRDWVSDLLSLPDRQAGYIFPAANRAISMIESGRIDAIYSTSPPASSHVAALIAHRVTGVPWIADFRDPWISNQFVSLRQTTYLDRFDSWLEECVIRNADRVIANTEELRDDFGERYPELADRFYTVTNGFDPDEEIVPPVEGPDTPRPFRITHAGTLYGHRNPMPLIKALEILHRRGSISPGDMELCLLGAVVNRADYLEYLDNSPVKDMVHFKDAVPRREALRFLASSDILLLIQAGTTLQIPRKLYEYFAVGRNILALVTPGATENLLRREGLGRIVRPDDPEVIADTLEAMRRTRECDRARRPERFNFRKLTGELVASLGEVI